MPTGRVLWIIFCCFMAACWMLGGFLFLGFGLIFTFPLALLSLAAIWLPVGKPPKHPLRPPAAGGHTTPPGWYEVSPGTLQWWDGYQWAPRWTTPHDLWQQDPHRWPPPGQQDPQRWPPPGPPVAPPPQWPPPTSLSSGP